MHLAFFTPLTPLHTALADHSEGILSHLSRLVEIDVYIDDGYQPTNKGLTETCAIRSHREFPHRAAAYDLIVYAFGNNVDFHDYMYPYIFRYPGVIVLHDTEYQHYFSTRALLHKTTISYQCEMERLYGEGGRRAANIALSGQIDRIRGLYPLSETLVDASVGVIVYNGYALEDVLRRRPFAKVVQLRYPFYLPAGLPDKIDVPSLRARWGLGDCFVVGSFGLFDTAEKRMAVRLRAFKQFLQMQPDAKYLLVGPTSSEVNLAHLLAELDLTDRVVLTGWLDVVDFAQHMCVPDVSVHLRFPHIGGTLYTPLRLMGLGQPTILSDIEPLAEFPEGCCAKILPDQYEEDILVEMLTLLAKNPDLRRQMGQNAMQFIDRYHRAELVAQEHLRTFEQFLSSGTQNQSIPISDEARHEVARSTGDILTQMGLTEHDDALLSPIAIALAAGTEPAPAPQDAQWSARSSSMEYNPDEVAAVLEALKMEVRGRRAPTQWPMREALSKLHAFSWVNPHQPIAWPSWPPGLWPKIAAALQKIIRRLLRWYINPLVEQQNEFNAVVEEILQQMVRENNELRADIRMLKGLQSTTAQPKCHRNGVGNDADTRR